MIRKVRVFPKEVLVYLKNCAVFVNKQKPKNKHWHIRPFKNAKFKLRELREAGFKISSNLWRSCTVNNEERNPGGKPKLPKEEIERISDFLYQDSRPSAYRVLKKTFSTCSKFDINEKSTKAIPVRFLNESLIDTHYFYKKKFKSNLSFSSLYKYKPKYYKKAYQETDICEYCTNNKLIQAKIKGLALKLNFLNIDLEDSRALLKSAKDKYEETCLEIVRLLDSQEVITPRKLENEIHMLLKFPSNAKTNADLVKDLKTQLLIPPIAENCPSLVKKVENETLILFLSLFELIHKIEHKHQLDFHREIAIRQRNAYNYFRQSKEFLKNNIFLEFDYKQKLNIGLGPLNNSFYKQRTISYLTFGLYYVENNEIKCINYDLLSDNLHQDSNAVIRGLRFIRSLESFKRIEANRKNYTVFCDCGSHFRSKSILYYFSDELARESILVSLNYFAPKHGKSLRDQHLSIIGFILRKKLESMVTIEEVCEFINSKYDHSNIVKESTKFLTYAFKLNPEKYEYVLIEERIVEHFKDYFNFRTLYKIENGSPKIRLFSSVFSDVDVDPLKLTGVIQIDSIYNSYAKQLDFHEPLIKKIDFPLEDEQKLIKWKAQEKRIKANLSLCSEASKFDQSDQNNDTPTIQISSSKINMTDHYKQKPLFCYFNCQSCMKHVKYTKDEIINKNFTNQKEILTELNIHGHKKYLWIKKIKRSRNMFEARDELIKHLETFHWKNHNIQKNNLGTQKPINETESKNKAPKKAKNRDNYPGMSNLVFTCFINSIFQVLNSIPKIVNYFLNEYSNSFDENDDYLRVSFYFSDLIKQSQKKEIKFINPQNFVECFLKIHSEYKFPFVKNVFCQQQDAHDFLRKLFDCLATGLCGDRNWSNIEKSFEVTFLIYFNMYKKFVITIF